MKLPLLALAALCAALATAAPAAAQIDGTVKIQLDSAVSMFRGQGFDLQGAYRSGSLADGAEAVVSLDLEGGRSYIIVGVCDSDCSDLDFALADASGTEVDNDYELDDVPMVAVEVARAATYRLTVGMATCSVEPCGYGVAVFAQR